MYAFVDRPIGRLDAGGRFLIWSMRFWVRAMMRSSCPRAEIGDAFVERDMEDAVAHFDMLMHILNRHARDNMGFGPIPCRRVHEGEALVLALLARTQHEPAMRTRQTLTMMVEDGWVEPLIVALSALSTRLASVGLLPQAPDGEALRTGDE